MITQYFKGQTAIITGAGAGMGREHALLLARYGAAIVVNSVTDSGQAVVDEIIASGGKAVFGKCDVSDPAQARELTLLAIENFGGVQIIVSNAGIINHKSFTEMTYEDFDHVMKVNAYGAFNIVNAAWPHLVEQNYGRVVMASSSSTFASQSSIGHYAASKGAILGLAKSLASEGVEHGITVNVLSPGAFTRMAGNLTDVKARKLREQTAPASLVAPVVGWLVLPENTINNAIVEAAAGRAAETFIGSTRGYWNKDLSIEDLINQKDQVFDRTGAGTFATTGESIRWSTMNTGWDTELATPTTEVPQG